MLRDEERVKVPFIDEVETFNRTFGKLVNTTPTIPDGKDADFVYDFIIEEAEELKEAYENNDIVGVLDALLDITYVSLGNGSLTFGLKDKILPAYAEVQASNMSKVCRSEDEAIETCKVRSQEQGEACHYGKVGEYYVAYRTRDNKVMKSINYFAPNLKQFFTEQELNG